MVETQSYNTCMHACIYIQLLIGYHNFHDWYNFLSAMAESKFLDRYHLKTNDIDVKICEDHLNEIAGICFDDWNDLYPFLGMDTKDIALIEAEPIPKTKAKSFFRLWKKRNGSNATYRRLIDALIKIKSIDGAESVCEILMSQNESVLESGTKSSGIGYSELSGHLQDQSKCPAVDYWGGEGSEGFISGMNLYYKSGQNTGVAIPD